MAAGTIRRMLLVYTELVVMMQIRSRRPISDEVTLLDGSYAAAGNSCLRACLRLARVHSCDLTQAPCVWEMLACVHCLEKPLHAGRGDCKDMGWLCVHAAR